MKTKGGIVAPERICWAVGIASAALHTIDAEIVATGNLLSDEDLAHMSGMLSVVLAGLEELRRFANGIGPSAMHPAQPVVKRLVR